MKVNIKSHIAEVIMEEIGHNADFSIEKSENRDRGDYSSNAALKVAHKLGKPPMEVAESVAADLREEYPDMFFSVVAAPPGFLNFFLSASCIQKHVEESLKPEKKKNLGKAGVEFISANPTGPLHIGNARGGPIGDTIANILEAAGYKVTREYFYNDAGAQMRRFSDSLWHWYLIACKKRSSFPKDGYQGKYLKDLAGAAKRKYGAKLIDDKTGGKKLLGFVLAKLFEENFAVIKDMGIKFDRVVFESKLAKTKTKAALSLLRRKKLLRERGGALWYCPKDEFLKDREVVVVKKDGTLLYFANDIAYHYDKFKKYDFVVDVFGEGHEGHIPKLYSIADTFGYPTNNFKVVVYGQVNLIKRGKVVTMAKRQGNFVTANEVLREVGKDAFRYFMLQYAPHSSMNFDITLARQQSKKNPVYYIQYAHARASSILRKSGMRVDPKKAVWDMLESAPELDLMKYILEYDEAVAATLADLGVQRLARYAYELARAFTVFYETTPVLDCDEQLKKARLALVAVAKSALERVLSLMGISAPDRM